MSKTVILIDDDQDDLDLMKETITKIDPAIFCISFIYPDEALRVVNRELAFIPDYIFIDINMRRLTGDKLLKEFRTNKALDNVVITMFSTSMPSTVSQALKDSGADFTFQKPSKVNEYPKVLSSILL
ncbi:MAG TPA: response regulator [Chryseosolibacter sp.]|nr:response regulator [Chryseosolibacter sp.]